MNFEELYEEINKHTVVVISKNSVGTGFTVNGKIATAEHVVSGSDDVEIIFPETNPDTLSAKVVKRDPKLDLALLELKQDARINNTKIKNVELGDSSSVAVGDEIIILGFPFGNKLWGFFKPAIHKGIISNIAQIVDPIDGKITKRFQLDVMANQGNSGGPLALNKNGKVIGILTSAFLEKPVGDFIEVEGKHITSPTGIAIATPIEYLEEMIKDIQKII